ncbi:hypothetical protein [Saccharopolyspora pogona]|uniref:hypothetical protein n=1 Tax=Saccharopolyspora pogona TaxID=333966 RepID=UPI00168267E0|nr:hypothetical protein [Saccharopolyspora pogona]
MHRFLASAARGRDRATTVETAIHQPGYPRGIVVALALWGFAYACYRAYYAAGGTVGMIGEPVSSAQFRAINAVGAAIILFAAVLLNEPWFLVEGLLWAALGVTFVATSRRRAWLMSAIVGCLLLTVVGVLSGLGVIGSFRFG